MYEERIPLIGENFPGPLGNLPIEILDKILGYIPEVYNQTVRISKLFAELSRNRNYNRAAHLWIDRIIDIQDCKYWVPDILEYDRHIEAAGSSDLHTEPSNRVSKSSIYQCSPIYKFLGSQLPNNMPSAQCCPTFSASMCRDPGIFSIWILLLIGLILFLGLYSIPQYLISLDQLYTTPETNSVFKKSIDFSNNCLSGISTIHNDATQGLDNLLRSIDMIKWHPQLLEFRNSSTFDQYFNDTKIWAIDLWKQHPRGWKVRYTPIYKPPLYLRMNFYIGAITGNTAISLFIYRFSRDCLIEYAKRPLNWILAAQIIPIIIFGLIWLFIFFYNYYIYKQYNL